MTTKSLKSRPSSKCPFCNKTTQFHKLYRYLCLSLPRALSCYLLLTVVPLFIYAICIATLDNTLFPVSQLESYGALEPRPASPRAARPASLTACWWTPSSPRVRVPASRLCGTFFFCSSRRNSALHSFMIQTKDAPDCMTFRPRRCPATACSSFHRTSE